jgi:hypothetical protein
LKYYQPQWARKVSLFVEGENMGTWIRRGYAVLLIGGRRFEEWYLGSFELDRAAIVNPLDSGLASSQAKLVIVRNFRVTLSGWRLHAPRDDD